MAGKFADARKNSEGLLDILEELSDTEEQRLDIIQSMIESYDTELTDTLKMHEDIGRQLVDYAEQGLQDSDEYVRLLEEANRLEEHGLDTIKAQHDYRVKLLKLEKERALKAAETAIYGEEGREAWEGSRQREIERLQDELDALDEDTSEADYLEELEEKEKTIAQLQEKLNNLQNQRTVRQLKQEEDGSWQWEYVTDQIAINETMAELEDAKNDLQKHKEDKALQDQKNAIQNRIDAIEEDIDFRADRYEEDERVIQEHYDRELEQQEKFTMEQIEDWYKHVNDVKSALSKLQTQTGQSLKEVTKTTEKGMDELSQAYQTSFDNIISQFDAFIDHALDVFWRLEAARKQAAEEAAAMTEGMVDATDNGGDESTSGFAKGLKFVEANNMLARLHYGERVLTRQEAAQYNELEDDIKSGKLQDYFNSMTLDTMNTVSNTVAANMVQPNTGQINNNSTNQNVFQISELSLPNVSNAQDFVNELNRWARNEFGGLSQKARIKTAK